jgi:hypothetical protein
MRLIRAIPAIALGAAMLAACHGPQQEKSATDATADSLAVVRKELFDEIIASTDFVNDVHEQLEKARVLALARPEAGEIRKIEEQREDALAGVTRLVARLDSVQTRLTSARNQVASLGRKESALLAQVADYQKNLTEMQAAAESQRAQLQSVVDQQNGQISVLSSQVDTLEKTRVALLDTVGRLTAQKNTAYVVVGTREELIKKGVLVAEGHKRFLVAGSRNVMPARKLDPSSFTKIDRLTDRTIVLPTGEYQILSRQNPEFATVTSGKSGKITGVMTIEQPEQFWETSPFLIIVKS